MPRLFGVTGWKNSGKTTLVAALVRNLTAQGLRVSTVKHASDGFRIDRDGTDSDIHRQAGAYETALVSDGRWALLHQNAADEDANTLEAMLGHLTPCDLVLVEGFKKSTVQKIECIRSENATREPVHRDNSSVVAIASDHNVETDLPVFALDDIDGIARFVLKNAVATA